MSLAFTSMGVLGILLITAGILIQNREHEDVLYALGGICLLIYSIFRDDMIFTALQVIFIAAAVYDFSRLHWGR